jgi:uncharacterized membrane protein
LRAAPPPAPSWTAARLHRLAVALVVALALLEAVWELGLAPLRPGGSWLALKALPLALVCLPLVRGARKARQVTSLLLPLFAAEGVVRALTESGRHAVVAACATVLAVAGLVALLMSFRAEKRAR